MSLRGHAILFTMNVALLAAFSLGVSLLLHLVALRLFPRIGLLDFPERYGLTRKRLPYPTGIISVLVFLAFFLGIAPLTMQTIGIALGVALLAILCFIDDRTPLPSSLRLSAHIGIALLIFLTGTRIFTVTNPLEMLTGFLYLKLDSYVIPSEIFANPPVLSGLFTLLWLGLTMNALNWFDGIPGQVSAIAVIGFLTIGFLSLSSRVDQPELATISFILAGLAAGGLMFDFPPARVLMGDTGAMFFGLMLGVLTIYAGGKVATAFLVLGVPLIDSFFVVVRRLAKGKSPFHGNANDEHLHHRLLAKGWSARQVILLTAALGSLFGITALFLDTLQKFIAAIVLLLIMFVLSLYSRPSPIGRG